MVFKNVSIANARCALVLYIDLRPGQTCHSNVMHRKEVTYSDGSYEKKLRKRAWLKKWDKVKISWYTQRLMHRKRVTCELHDSYFRLMAIKNAIPKIVWAIELLYNSVKTGSQWVGDQRNWRKMWLRKPPPSRKGPRDPRLSWRADELESRCGRESHHPAEGALGTPEWVWRLVGEKMLEWEYVPERLGPQLSSPRERDRHTVMSGGAGEVNVWQSLFSLQPPLTRKPFK